VKASWLTSEWRNAVPPVSNYDRERTKEQEYSMHSTLIVARMNPDSADNVARIFSDFDATDMPDLMGTRRRELFMFHGLYFHLQDFDSETGGNAIEHAKNHPLFVKVSDDLRPYIDAYDPATWRSPADAMAKRFYHWSRVQETLVPGGKSA
jgi:cyclase